MATEYLDCRYCGYEMAGAITDVCFDCSSKSGKDDPILLAVARALFVGSWANWAEENSDITLAGVQLENVAPETPDEFILNAARLIGAVEALNGRGDIPTNIRVLMSQTKGLEDQRDPKHFDSLEEFFGHYLAMQAMGSGVGLWEYSQQWCIDGEFRMPYWEALIYEGERGTSGKVAEALEQARVSVQEAWTEASHGKTASLHWIRAKCEDALSRITEIKESL